jgi:hypothetical protein
MILFHVEQYYMPHSPTDSIDFIAGIISVTGSFFWARRGNTKSPVFQVKLQSADKELLEIIRTGFNLSEKLYEYQYGNRQSVTILVRSKDTIINVIIPVLNGRLHGKAATQFDLWKDQILENLLGLSA